ncbi:hypothetical protein K788_0001127 (plasmid) [Paraburkholderia caribensis MBA4]|uniref:DUF1330 domain-containing protein n=1 Tax=Paraburkholderia caribensis MBA4 TaxID=1323664 RepID=A0A0P0RND6_9BURK|nr:DUF1330 domain-containing protein [Paraburkholderia caribensis]ALL70536.1 hypothetical protein K788_0001127 [Paraburkholderia caribensis MBA4]
MTAYMIFTRESTQDQTALDAYRAKVRDTFDGYAHKVLAAYGAQQVLEGKPAEATVILEFPSLAAARAWYDSEAYQQVAQHRLQGSRHRVVLIEGL